MLSLYDRNTYITKLSNGSNDVLSDKLLNKISSVPIGTSYRVQVATEFRSDKISAKFLGDSSGYWVILEYNKLLSNNALVAGLVINIPNIQYLNSVLIEANKGLTVSKQIYIK